MHRRILTSTLTLALLASLHATSTGQGISILESPAGSSTSTPTAPLPAEDVQAEELPLPAAEPAISSASPRRTVEPTPLAQAHQVRLVPNIALHEAFANHAQPITTASSIVPSEPPQPILEQPARQLTEGTNRSWIPGYWTWHTPSKGFVWTSGLWREIPPGRQWVAGRWYQVTGGFRWSSGYWADVSLANLAPPTLPAPPRNGHYGPTKSTTSTTSFWLPGEYAWNGSQYTFRSGYWTKQQSKFIWQPSTYIQTPGGYVFVSGYWDHEFAARGLPYASVAFPALNSGAAPPNFQPTYLVSTGSGLLLNMFVRPNDSKFYFGDYYDYQEGSSGFLPWHNPDAAAYTTLPAVDFYAWKYSQQGVDFTRSMQRHEQTLRGQVRYRPVLGPAHVAGLNVAFTDAVSGSTSQLAQLALSSRPAARVSQSSQPYQPSQASVTNFGPTIARSAPTPTRQNLRPIPQSPAPARQPQSLQPTPRSSVAASPPVARSIPRTATPRATSPRGLAPPAFIVRTPAGTLLIPPPLAAQLMRGRPPFAPPIAPPRGLPSRIGIPFPTPPPFPGPVRRGRLGRR